MAFIQWKDEYNIGIEHVDELHRRMVHLINCLVKDKCSSDEVLDELLELAQAHFVDEEKLMSDAGYPDLDQHRREHDRLLRIVQGARSDVRDRSLPYTPTMLACIRDDLLHHFLQTDRHYGDFLLTRSET